MNIVTTNAFGDEPSGWIRAEWVTLRPGVRMIRYQTDYDLTVFLRNIAVVGALARAWQLGNENGKWKPR